QRAWVEGLEEELRKHRPAALTALLSATALLRVASVGTAVAVQLDVSAFSGDRPSGVAIGLVGASQAITEMLFAPFMARLADRFGRSRFLVGGPIIGALGVLLVALATSAAHVVGSRLIEGVGAAAFVPVALGTIAAATSGSQPIRARASGAFEGSTLAGYAGGFALGTFLWPAMHRGAFLVMAAIYLMAAVICGGWVRHLHPMRVSPIRTVLRAVLGPGPMRSFMPAWISCFALLGAFVAHLPAILRHEPVPGQTLMHHFDARFIGVVLVTWVVLFLIGIVLWTPFLSRGRPLRIMLPAVPGAWLIVVTLLLINHLPLMWAPLVLPFLAIGVLWLAGFGPAAVAYLADCTEQLVSDRAALMSFYTVALAGGGAIGAVLGGVAVRWLHADGLFLLGLLLSTLAFSLLSRVARQDGTGRASAAVAMAG
ncbi:MAG TPA: MFS transporter, partial [Candidatus Dormibacteraeota bacterium]|nr:MFS transporter [Candidatus Dormibacteraeota bacterium]